MGQAQPHVGNIADKTKLNDENYGHSVLVFRDRQAGVSEIYDPEFNRYSYNASLPKLQILRQIQLLYFFTRLTGPGRNFI